MLDGLGLLSMSHRPAECLDSLAACLCLRSTSVVQCAALRHPWPWSVAAFLQTRQSCKPSAPRAQLIETARRIANRLPCGRAAGAIQEQLGQLLSPAISQFAALRGWNPELSASINCVHGAQLSRTRLGSARSEALADRRLLDAGVLDGLLCVPCMIR